MASQRLNKTPPRGKHLRDATILTTLTWVPNKKQPRLPNPCSLEGLEPYGHPKVAPPPYLSTQGGRPRLPTLGRIAHTIGTQKKAGSSLFYLL